MSHTILLDQTLLSSETTGLVFEQSVTGMVVNGSNCCTVWHRSQPDTVVDVQVFFNVCDKQELMFHAVVLQANCCQNIIQVQTLTIDATLGCFVQACVVLVMQVRHDHSPELCT